MKESDFNRIVEGLKEALAHARGEGVAERVTVYKITDPAECAEIKSQLAPHSDKP